jgi:uncharacterized protein (TIGR00251 family)
MNTPENPIEPCPGGCRIYLYARPRASRTKITGVHDGRVKIQIAAPPVDGAANAEVIKFLSSKLGVRKSAIEFVAGNTGKRKTIFADGVDAGMAKEKLGI